MPTKRSAAPSGKEPELERWPPSRVKRSKNSLVDSVARLLQRSLRDRQRGLILPDEAYGSLGLVLARHTLRAAEGMRLTTPSVLIACKVLVAAVFVELDGIVTQGEAESLRLVTSMERIGHFTRDLETLVREWPCSRAKKPRSGLGVQ